MTETLTLLEIVQTATAELGLIQPTTVIGNADLQIVQLLALVNRDGTELYKSHPWTALQGEHIINVEEPTNTTGNVVEGSRIISNIPSTTGIEAGSYAVSGSGIPSAQRITSVDSATQVTCEMENTGTYAATDLVFARDTYEIPSDFDRYIDHTWWDRTNHWMLVGPQSPQFDQWQRSGIVTTGPRRRWRQIGVRPTVYRLWPVPSAEDTPAALVFDFISDGWVLHEDGTYGTKFTADTDVAIINSQALVLGAKWRFYQIKGLSYASMQQEYIDFVNREKARDGGSPDLSMNSRRRGYLLTTANVQDGFYPGGG